MSRIGRKILPLPKGVTLAQKPGLISVKGPKGELTKAVPDGHHHQDRGGQDHGPARRRLAPEPRQARPDARAPGQHGQGRHRRVDARAGDQRRRLPRRGRRRHDQHGARLLAPGGVQAAEGRHRQGRQEPRHAHERGPRPGRPDRRQGARAASSRAVQGQGRQVRRRSHQEEGRQGRRHGLAAAAAKPRARGTTEDQHAHRHQLSRRREPQEAASLAAQADRGDRGAAAPGRVPQHPPHLRPGHRRSAEDARWRRSPTRCWPSRARRRPTRRRAPRRSAPRSPSSASRRGSTRSCSIAPATSTTDASRRSPTARAKPG